MWHGVTFCFNCLWFQIKRDFFPNKSTSHICCWIGYGSPCRWESSVAYVRCLWNWDVLAVKTVSLSWTDNAAHEKKCEDCGCKTRLTDGTVDGTVALQVSRVSWLQWCRDGSLVYPVAVWLMIWYIWSLWKSTLYCSTHLKVKWICRS